jgi:hypothetical protein
MRVHTGEKPFKYVNSPKSRLFSFNFCLQVQEFSVDLYELFGPRLWRMSVRPSAKTLTLASLSTFDWLVLGLSYFTCVFLLARPFI